MGIIELAIVSLLYILPAYIANSSAALFGGGFPLDFGKNFFDGKRLFGNGKTFRGLFLGLLFGIAAGNVEGFFLLGTSFSLGPVEFYTELGILLSVGALLGDLCASFVKRRLGFKQGQMFPIVDQLDFVVGAIIFSALLYMPTLEMVVFLIIITPIIHLVLNTIGYLLKLKRVPW
jgi:CDP-2,3-bis-(O-geranylgeranyl)-sn-glycerol synthase